jgi:hypothetical protein
VLVPHIVSGEGPGAINRYYTAKVCSMTSHALSFSLGSSGVLQLSNEQSSEAAFVQRLMPSSTCCN